MGTRVLQLHKRSSYEFKFIQDRLSLSLENRIYALADGTTQSFYSERWAEIITSLFVKQPLFETDKLIKLFNEGANQFTEIGFTLSANPAKAALEKRKIEDGATATFIGLQIDNSSAKIISSGDSNIFHIEKDKIELFPFNTCEELDNNKHFINTEKLRSNEVDESYFIKGNIDLTNDSIILICSDALSRLLLNNPSCIDMVIKISTFEELLAFCVSYWDKKLMQEDDISCIIIDTATSNKQIFITPPEGFSFPKEEEYEFIPSKQEIPILNQINNADMEYLVSMINRLYGQLNDITKKTKLYLVILISILIFSTANFLMAISKSSSEPSTRDSGERDFQRILEEKEMKIKDLERRIDNLTNKLNESPDQTLQQLEPSNEQDSPKIHKGTPVKTVEK